MIDNVCTASSQDDSTLTVEKLKEMVELVGDDPVVKFMKEKGCDPAKGWRLMYPPSMGMEFNHRFCMLSHHISEPVFINIKTFSRFQWSDQ